MVHHAKQPLLCLVAGFVVIAFCATRANGASISAVSPGAAASTEGSGSLSIVVGSGTRAQQLYPASDFLAVPTDQDTIVRYDVRADASQSLPATVNFADFELRLSTVSITSLSTTFADNIGTDETVVYSGPLTLSYTGSGTPNPFVTGVVFQTPFQYDPTQGNLLVDIKTNSGNDILFHWDAYGSGTDITVISTLDPSSLVADELELPFLQVAQFTFVPEPSTVVLATMGLVGLAAFGWRRRKRTNIFEEGR